MSRFFVALIGIPAGFLIMIYRFQIKQFFGNISFAEQYFGQGGTYTFLIILGLVISFLSLMYGLGTFQDLFNGILAPFFGK